MFKCHYFSGSLVCITSRQKRLLAVEYHFEKNIFLGKYLLLRLRLDSSVAAHAVAGAVTALALHRQRARAPEDRPGGAANEGHDPPDRGGQHDGRRREARHTEWPQEAPEEDEASGAERLDGHELRAKSYVFSNYSRSKQLVSNF